MSIPDSNGKTVLITGINGYIASVLGQLLLTNGYSVRGTTRRLASAEPLLNGPYAKYQDRVKIFEVPDMTISGAFDEASKGVDGIFHTASPIDFTLDTYETTVYQAVKGTETALFSALKAGSRLKSVVVTASFASIADPSNPPDHVYTEADFAFTQLELAEKNKIEGKYTSSGVLYYASKTAAERAVWKFKDEHKPSFSLTTIHPTVVVGPPIVLPSSGSKLNDTVRPVFKLLSGEAKTVPPNIGSGFFVDVRDVAFEHLWAFEHPDKANGQRYLASSGVGPTQAIADILRYHYKGTPIEKNIPVGDPGASYEGFDKETGKVTYVKQLPGKVNVDGSKAERDMGLKHIDFVQSVIETAKVLEALL